MSAQGTLWPYCADLNTGALSLPKARPDLLCPDCRGRLVYLSARPLASSEGFKVSVAACHPCRKSFGFKEESIQAVEVDYYESVLVIGVDD